MSNLSDGARIALGSKFVRPRLDPTAQLLVLLSRPTLSRDVRDRILALVDQIEDWRELVVLAGQNFCLPFAYHHFSELGLTKSHSSLMALLRPAALGLGIENLKWQAAAQTFSQNCLQPVKAKHAFFKGPALSAGYYPNPGLRLCRDIDVLVAENHFESVARKALDLGYKFILDIDPLQYAVDKQDIRFVIRHSDVIAAHDPTGFMFDIHRRVEKQTPLFPADDVLAAAEIVAIGSTSVSAMSTNWLFCYLAYHHSRHFWSKLHWVADIHAVSGSPLFNREQTLDLAGRIGIRRLVEATLDFAALTDVPETWVDVLGSSRLDARFLEGCLYGLPGDSSYEFQRRQHMFLFDFEGDWLIDHSKKHWFWAGSALRRLEPNLTQYMKNRRRAAFEFLYRIENFCVLGKNLLTRMRARRT